MDTSSEQQTVRQAEKPIAGLGVGQDILYASYTNIITMFNFYSTIFGFLETGTYSGLFC